MADIPCSTLDAAASRRSRDALAAIVRAWRGERKLRATAAKLASLSDHSLRDIGLARGDIAAFVRSLPAER